VRRVEPSAFTKISALGVEEQRVYVVLDLIDGPPTAGDHLERGPDTRAPSLGDGYQAELRIIVWQRDDVLRVPVSALFREGGDWAVFVVEGARARKRRVELGHRNDTEAEVLGGLPAAATVIVHPGDLVVDGRRVERL
jgi:HlyD family secretion protein